MVRDKPTRGSGINLRSDVHADFLYVKFHVGQQHLTCLNVVQVDVVTVQDEVREVE